MASRSIPGQERSLCHLEHGSSYFSRTCRIFLSLSPEKYLYRGSENRWHNPRDYSRKAFDREHPVMPTQARLSSWEKNQNGSKKQRPRARRRVQGPAVCPQHQISRISQASGDSSREVIEHTNILRSRGIHIDRLLINQA